MLQEPQGDLRRSPRLRERYSRERSEGPSALTTVQFLRPCLSGYNSQWEQNILNESGQSVPSDFDLEQPTGMHLDTCAFTMTNRS